MQSLVNIWKKVVGYDYVKRLVVRKKTPVILKKHVARWFGGKLLNRSAILQAQWVYDLKGVSSHELWCEHAYTGTYVKDA
jgi:hypothetical protein